jgi:hypothetical protein
MYKIWASAYDTYRAVAATIAPQTYDMQDTCAGSTLELRGPLQVVS